MTSTKFFDAFSLVVTRGQLVVTRGHSWSFVVTRGHSWSLVCTFRDDPVEGLYQALFLVSPVPPEYFTERNENRA